MASLSGTIVSISRIPMITVDQIEQLNVPIGPMNNKIKCFLTLACLHKKTCTDFSSTSISFLSKMHPIKDFTNKVLKMMKPSYSGHISVTDNSSDPIVPAI